MVALNTAYAAPKNAADPKNRVGDFFYEDHASVGKNRWASRLNAQEKSSYHYETASGRSNWPNRDPYGEVGGPTWFERDKAYKRLFKLRLPHDFYIEAKLELTKPSELISDANLYSFVGNQVVSRIDILGLTANCCGSQPLASGKRCCGGQTQYTPRRERCCSSGNVVLGGRGSYKRCQCVDSGGRYITKSECLGGFNQCMESCLTAAGGWVGAGGLGGGLAGYLAALRGANPHVSLAIGTAAYTGCAAGCGQPTCCRN